MPAEWTTIGEAFEGLRESAPYTQSRAIMSRRLLLRAPRPGLLEDFARAFVALETDRAPAPADPTDECIVTPSRTFPAWRSAMGARLSRVFNHAGFGRIEVADVCDGIAVTQAGFGSLLLAADGRGLCLVHAADGTAPRGHLRNLFGLAQILTSELLGRADCSFAHAAGVGRDGHCELLSGPSGIGKTTRALQLVSAGYAFFGDDQVVLGKGPEGAWWAWPYWRAVGVPPDAFDRVPGLHRPAHPASDNGKYVGPIDALFPIRPPAAAPVDAIHVLSTDAGMGMTRLSVEEGLEELGRHFFSYRWTADASRWLDAMCEICESVPIYRVSRGLLDAEGLGYWHEHERSTR